MSTLRLRAEIEKLARLLGTDHERLAYLQKLSADEVHELRELATDRLFDADKGALDRIAAASGIVTVGLAATLSQKVFGPLLSARITAAVPSSTAIGVARKLPHDFLADVAALLDPRRASDVISGLPAEHIARTSRVLAQRGEWVAMGRFVGHLNREALGQTIEGLDDEALLRIAFVMEEPETLATVVALMPADRIAGTLRAAFEHALWPEAISLLAHLDDTQTGRVLDELAEQDDDLLSDLARTANTQQLWPELLAVVPAMKKDGRRRFALLPPVQEAAAVKAIVAEAVGHGLQDELLMLLAALAPPEQEAFAELALHVPATQRRELHARATERGLLEHLGPLGDVI